MGLHLEGSVLPDIVWSRHRVQHDEVALSSLQPRTLEPLSGPCRLIPTMLLSGQVNQVLNYMVSYEISLKVISRF